MKVIIAGGGTGGHIFPALAIAEEFLDRDKNNNILFIGTTKGMENKLINDKGYELMYIRSAPIMGKGIWAKVMGALIAFVGMFDSCWIIRRFKPDVVVGVGGYVSGPVLISSYMFGVPRVICEQNSIPGFTNRILSHIAKKVFISFENSRRYFPRNKTILTGNPIQKKIVNAKRHASMRVDQICILVLGGSQGASKLNEILPQTFKDLRDSDIKVIHQTGERDYANVSRTYNGYKLDAEVYDFVNDMERLYELADIVIARSGAGTVAEISALGIPSILIPFPYATHNHQYHNAKVLQNAGASVLIEEKDLTSDNLGAAIKEIISDQVLKDMGGKAKQTGKPDASKLVVDKIYEMVNKKNV